MTIQIPSQILLSEVTEFLQKLIKMDQALSTLPIERQQTAINQFTVTEQHRFQELQNKVDTFFQANPFSVEDSTQIQQKLSESLVHVKNISATNDQLRIYNECYNQAQAALNSPIPNREKAMQSLLQRMTHITSNPHLNRGVSLACQKLQSNLQNAMLVQQLVKEWSSVKSRWSLTKQQVKGSYIEMHADFLTFFKKLQAYANDNPTLKEDREFAKMHQAILDQFDRLHHAQANDQSTRQQMIDAFNEVKTPPIIGTQQAGRPLPLIHREDHDKESLREYIKELERAVHFLKHDNQNAVDNAVAILNSLFQSQSSYVFAMSGMESILIASRPFFHLYHIHKNEDPSLLKDDKDYGYKAFLGTHDSFTATNAQRSQALKRTIAELALAGLEDAMHLEAAHGATVFLNILEKTELQRDDLPKGMNIAHALFDTLYRLHTQARKSNPNLIDPNLSRFNEDFGRAAFPLFIDGPVKKDKLQAIEEIRGALKTAWKVS